jgi:hypothetical protein
MRQKWILGIAGIGLLGIVAIAGCNRNAQPTSVLNPGVDVAPVNAYPPASNYTTVEEPGYGMRPPVRTISPQQFEAQQPYPQQPYVDAPRPYDARRPYYADRTTTYVERRPRVVTRERSFGHSAAIVGGSAGVGAAIGALAGGGKGAGIGALAGGGGGFIYDRLTHRKRVVVEER